MGWWKQDAKGHSFAEEGDLCDLWWGDGPADVIDAALAAVTQEFQEEFARKPTRAELAAGFLFSLRAVDADPLYSEIELEPSATIEHVEAMVERIREVAFPELVTEGGIPKRIVIEWKDAAADDPWELRACVAELETDLAGYFQRPLELGRPRPKAAA